MPKNSKRGPSKKHSKLKQNYTKTKSVNKSNKILSKMKSSRNKTKKEIEYINLINEHGNFTRKILEYEAEKHPVASISHAKLLKKNARIAAKRGEYSQAVLYYLTMISILSSLNTNYDNRLGEDVNTYINWYQNDCMPKKMNTIRTRKLKKKAVKLNKNLGKSRKKSQSLKKQLEKIQKEKIRQLVENYKVDKEIQKILSKNKSTQTSIRDISPPRLLSSSKKQKKTLRGLPIHHMMWDPSTQSFLTIPKRLNRFDRIPNRPKKGGKRKRRTYKKKLRRRNKTRKRT